MDIEKFSNLEVDTVCKINTDACNEMKKLENEIDQAEEALSVKKAKYKDYQERKIPELMQEAGVNAIKLLMVAS